jgi:two-component system, response regulator PdtaR
VQRFDVGELADVVMLAPGEEPPHSMQVHRAGALVADAQDVEGTALSGEPFTSMESEPKTVVVAEDEILLRVLAVAVLTKAGFDVIEAGNAEEALATLQARLGAIHLLFTDIHMPGRLNGLELAHHVRGAWPKIALLITSGGLPAKLPAGSIFLAKPYDLVHVVAHAQTLTAS